MKQIVFFASGSGSNLQAVIDAIEQGKIKAHIGGLITNKDGIKALERAEKHHIPTKILNPSSFSHTQKYEQALADTLKKWQPNLIVLAGYLLKIPASIIRAYKNRMINIHPSLLPKFGGKGLYGINVHRAVLNRGETQSGCSVHIVTEEYDQGPVLAQRTVPVYKTDTPENLSKRVLQQEHQLLPEVINKLLTDSNSKA